MILSYPFSNIFINQKNSLLYFFIRKMRKRIFLTILYNACIFIKLFNTSSKLFTKVGFIIRLIQNTVYTILYQLCRGTGSCTYNKAFA